MKSSGCPQPTTPYLQTQYTNYLQAQLQKITAYILQQQKKQQKNKYNQQNVANLQREMDLLKDRVKILQCCQKENFRICERIGSRQKQNNKSQYAQQNMEDRLRKVQAICFDRSLANKNKQNHINHLNIDNKFISQTNKNNQQIVGYIDKIHDQLSRKIRQIQQQINAISYSQCDPKQKDNILNVHYSKNYAKSRESEPILTNYSQVNSIQNSYTPHGNGNGDNFKTVSKAELKSLQNKMFVVFDEKFGNIQKMIRKSFRKQSKSPTKSSYNSKNNNQNILLKQQTFGFDNGSYKNKKQLKDDKQFFSSVVHKSQQNSIKNNQNEYEISNTKSKFSPHQNYNQMSYDNQVSEVSNRLRPMNQQLMGQTIQSVSSCKQKNKVKRKSKMSSSKNIQKSKSKSRSISQQIEKSKSKSAKKQHIKPSKSFNAHLKQVKQLISRKSHSKKSIQKSSRSVSRSRSRNQSFLSNEQKQKSIKNDKNRSKSPVVKQKMSKSPIKIDRSPKHKNNRKKQGKNSINKQYRMNCLKNHCL